MSNIPNQPVPAAPIVEEARQDPNPNGPHSREYVDNDINPEPQEVDDPASPSGKSRVWFRNNGQEVRREPITLVNQAGVESVSAAGTVPAGAMPTTAPATRPGTPAPAPAVAGNVAVPEVSKSASATTAATDPKTGNRVAQ